MIYFCYLNDTNKNYYKYIVKFKISYNTIYLGMSAILLGIPLISENLAAFIRPILFILIINTLFLKISIK